MWTQRSLMLRSKSKGFHLITAEVEKELKDVIGTVRCGLLHVFIQHTSAALTLNENADETVRQDFESVFNVLVPENQSYYQHNDEGPDDLPAHIKASLLGASVTIPIQDGRLALGTWQGIYLCELRQHGGARKLLITLQGET
ncbi:MAG: secondary thiamine-phosphate synthase enzyme YjbQ [Oleibacter sp.]|nr:secondary thiamine-phosphate synthase enzyme YjbQ [Thalassolituus sp.]